MDTNVKINGYKREIYEIYSRFYPDLKGKGGKDLPKVTPLFTEDPPHLILSCHDPRGWTMTRGPPACFVVASGGGL